MAKERRSYGSIVRRRKSDGKFVPVNYRGKDPLRDGFYVRVRSRGGAVVRHAGATKAEAEQFLSKLQREEWEERVLGVRAIAEVTFEDFAKDYLKHVERTHAPSTVRNTRLRIDNILVKELGPKFLSTIRRDDIVRFLDKRAADGAKIATRNRYAALLSAMFSRAVSLNFARENPVDGVKRPAEALRDVPFLAIDAQEKLVEKCDEMIRPLVALALDTGLRRGELLALTWADVDLTRGVVCVRRAKNGEPREVPIRARSRALLDGRRKSRVVPMQGPDRVFSWIPETFPGAWNDLYHAAAKAAELPRLRFHDLRHLAAVNLVRAGVPLSDVGRFLGHKTLTMVLRYSRHSPADSAFRALDALEAYHSRVQTPAATAGAS